MKKQLIYLAAILLLLTACSGNETPSNDNKDVVFGVIVMNEQGENLLNMLTPSAYRYETIQMYREIDGVWKRFYEPLYDHPKGFEVYTEDTDWMVVYEPSVNAMSPHSNTLIQWNENDADTIRCEYRMVPGDLTCIRIWVNSELAWDITDKSSKYSARVIEIIRPD